MNLIFKKMETLNVKHLKTLEKDDLKKIYGGKAQDLTAQTIRTFTPEGGERWDTGYADDTPKGPILT